MKNGYLIKQRYAYDGINHQRIDRFYLRDDSGNLVDCSEDNGIKTLKTKLDQTNKSKIFSLETFRL